MQLSFTNKSFIPKLVVAIGVCGFLYGFFSNRRTTYESKTNWFRYDITDNIDTKVKFNDNLETTIESTSESTGKTTNESTNESTSESTNNINEVE
jgi:hypothetical protein